MSAVMAKEVSLTRRKMDKAPQFFIGILIFCCWIAVANAEYRIYQDPKQPIGRRVKDLLGRMTLEEKIGQMTQIDRVVASDEVLKKYHIGKHFSIASENSILVVHNYLSEPQIWSRQCVEWRR